VRQPSVLHSSGHQVSQEPCQRDRIAHAGHSSSAALDSDLSNLRPGSHLDVRLISISFTGCPMKLPRTHGLNSMSFSTKFVRGDMTEAYICLPRVSQRYSPTSRIKTHDRSTARSARISAQSRERARTWCPDIDRVLVCSLGRGNERGSRIRYHEEVSCCCSLLPSIVDISWHSVFGRGRHIVS